MKLELDTALIRSSLGHGVAVMRQSWRQFWPLMLVVSVLEFGATRLAVWQTLCFQPLIWATVGISLRGALFRIADSEHKGDSSGLGPFGLQWRGIEGRLLVATICKWALLAFLCILIMFFAYVLINIIAYGGSKGFDLTPSSHQVSKPGHWGNLTIYIITLLSLGGMVWLSIRLILSDAASAYSDRFQVLSTLRLTANNTLNVLVIAILTSLPGELLKLGVNAAERNGLGSIAILVLGPAVYWGINLSFLPLSIGAQAALYRSLKARHNPVEVPQDSGAKD